MELYGIPPAWLAEPANAVLIDLQCGLPIAGLTVTASIDAFRNGLVLGVTDDAAAAHLPVLIDDLDPESDEDRDAVGSAFVPRSETGAALLVHIADVLQGDLTETTTAGWAQARPPCPHHRHPATPIEQDGEAWWICSTTRQPLFRIGRGEVPRRLLPDARSPTGETDRKRKRQAKRR